MINPPKTLEEAQKLKYGPSYRAVGFRYGQCAYRVHGGRFMSFHQCPRKSGHGPDNIYCKQHAKMVAE